MMAWVYTYSEMITATDLANIDLLIQYNKKKEKKGKKCFPCDKNELRISSLTCLSIVQQC